MASRYPTTKVFDYCYSPIHIVDESKDVVVPCGKCDGCRLHKANEWSQRLSAEIDSMPYSVFTTLTYNNYYLPKLIKVQDATFSYCYNWISDHKDNVRATLKFTDDGLVVVNKLRTDGIVVNRSYSPIAVTNFSDYSCIPYASKRDLQLYFKLLRKLIDVCFPDKTIDAKRFRYFAISEYGETKFRPHFHIIFGFFDKEVSTYCTEYAFSACWPMCDKNRITDYTQYCDSRAGGYLTQYVNSLSRLPKVYEEVKELRPFRLSSKAFAIGFNQFDQKAVSEQIVGGGFTFNREYSSLQRKYTLRFPKGYISALFPKCFEFSRKSFDGLYRLYSLFYVEMSDSSLCRQCRVCEYSSRYTCVSLRLRSYLRPQDYNATKKCYDFCKVNHWHPFWYVYALDMAYYKQAMFSLKMFYEYQQLLADSKQWLSIGRMYSNFMDLWNKIANGNDYDIFVARLFFESICIDCADIDSYDHYQLSQPSVDFSQYQLEVDDILQDMVKLPKLNEKLGVSPVNCY